MLCRNQERTGQEAGTLGQPTVRMARGDEEIVQALSLVHAAYVRSGLIEPNVFQLRVMPCHLLSTTEVIVAVLRGEVVATATVVGDGQLGLPMEGLYSAEVKARRSRGRHLAEVSCFADRREHLERQFPLVARLMSLAIQCAARRGSDELLIAVHPRHGSFYERFFGFRVIGELKAYQAVNNHPAVPLSLDLRQLESVCPRGYQRVFRETFADADFCYQPPSEELLAHLGRVIHSLSDSQATAMIHDVRVAETPVTVSF
jgi:hypothetical protein